MRSVGAWVDWERTCDGFKYGDPDAEVRGIAVGWQSLQSALEEAHERGCNLFITHEPTFYSHMDDDESLRESEPARRKAEYLDRTGMVIYRCHDVWDTFPGIGILDAWSEFLGLGEAIATDRYYHLHQVPSTSAWELAHRIARKVAELGEQNVEFVGTRWQMVSRLAVGTGAITRPRGMVDLGADVLLVTDDGITYWGDGAWLADMGIPYIVVNHMTAEIPGLYKMVEYLREQFPDVPVEFVGPTCSYDLWASERMRDTPIRMRLDSLADLPPLEVPEGYELRPMQADEWWAYLQVMNRSNFAGEADEAWFRRTFSDDAEYDPSYLQIIWRGDRPVAAAAAWHRGSGDDRWGMIHWVGADANERGRGLGKAVTLAALHRLRERGFERAILDTAGWRMAAVAAYMRLGFRPWPTEAAPQSTWDRILAEMKTWRAQRRA